MKDYYSILGVSKDADEVVIRAAYKALAQKYHPDKAVSELRVSHSARMKEINEAYAVLGNAEKKKSHDTRFSSTDKAMSKAHEKSNESPVGRPDNFWRDQLIPDRKGWEAFGLGIVLFLIALILGVIFMK